MKKHDIICISTHYWNDFWFRKQHFMSRFAALGHRILYVQPSFSVMRMNEKPGIARNRLVLPFLEKQTENIYLFSPPRLLPKPGTAISSKLSYRRFANLIHRAAAKLNMNDPVLWIYRPEYATGIDLITHSSLVFDLADDLAAYSDNPTRHKYLTKCIDKLVGSSDLMVVTSPTLYDKYKHSTRNCVLVPNGFDEELFDGKPKPVPSDLADIPRPVVGFIGVLFSFLDYDLIYDTANTLSTVSFVFVGPTEKGGRHGVERLKTLPNTYFLGRKAKEQIPSYVLNFDVCINPFKEDNVSRAVSPLKVYEYLACGKPVVSTPMEGLRREEAGRWISFAKREQFADEISEALNGRTRNRDSEGCVEATRGFSWTSQFHKLQKHLVEF